jgi:mycoredoxin
VVPELSNLFLTITNRDGGTLMSEKVTMYSTPWCGYCQRLKAQMGREGIEYNEIDIEQDPAAEQFVMGVNSGNAVVPTLVFPDGSTRTNPSIGEVKSLLGL